MQLVRVQNRLICVFIFITHRHRHQEPLLELLNSVSMIYGIKHCEYENKTGETAPHFRNTITVDAYALRNTEVTMGFFKVQ